MSEQYPEAIYAFAESVERWQARAEAAESALAELRGEVVALREALKSAQDYLQAWEDRGDSSVRWTRCQIEAALTATPASAALGALVEAALNRREAELACLRFSGDPTRQPREYAELTHGLINAERVENAAADAVLAMGKEGPTMAEKLDIIKCPECGQLGRVWHEDAGHWTVVHESRTDHRNDLAYCCVFDDDPRTDATTPATGEEPREVPKAGGETINVGGRPMIVHPLLVDEVKKVAATMDGDATKKESAT